MLVADRHWVGSDRAEEELCLGESGPSPRSAAHDWQPMSHLGTWENHSLWPQIFKHPLELGHPFPINSHISFHVQMPTFGDTPEA